MFRFMGAMLAVLIMSTFPANAQKVMVTPLPVVCGSNKDMVTIFRPNQPVTLIKGKSVRDIGVVSLEIWGDREQKKFVIIEHLPSGVSCVTTMGTQLEFGVEIGNMVRQAEENRNEWLKTVFSLQ